MGRILVIIPAYNEGENIVRVVKCVRRVLPRAEVVVVNDGSIDKTAEVARKAGATVLSHPDNLGYGVALQTGYKYALLQKADFVVQMDGDGQHDPSFIPTLLESVKKGEVDISLGSRFLKHSYKAPLFRRLGTSVFSEIVSLITGKKFTDPTSGFQALNNRAISFYAGNIYPTDFPDADIILMDHLTGFRIKEVPVKMYPSATGKSMHSGLKPLYYIFKMFLSIFITLIRKREKLEGGK